MVKFKIFKTDRGSEWFKTYVETAIFNTTKKVDLIISEVENLFTDKLENGNRQRAMKRLRVPPFEEKVIKNKSIFCFHNRKRK